MWEWKTGLAVKYVAPRLSHQEQELAAVDCTHATSTAPLANALYSTSVLERDMVGCLRAVDQVRTKEHSETASQMFVIGTPRPIGIGKQTQQDRRRTAKTYSSRRRSFDRAQNALDALPMDISWS